MSIIWCLGFMALGGAIVGFFNAMAWKKYYEGKREGQAYKRKDNA